MREKMPRVIKIALVLSFLSIVIEVAAPIVHEGVFIKNFLNYASGHDHKYVAMFGPCVKITEILVTGFFGAILLLALAYGKSWARKTYIVLFALGAINAVCGALLARTSCPADVIDPFRRWNWASLAIDAIIVGLLFLRVSKAWYKFDATIENRWKNRFQCTLFWFLLLLIEFALGFVQGIATGMQKCGNLHEKYPHIRVAELKARSDQGDAPSMWRLGNWERNGWLGEKHPEKAFEWYQKAADLGDRWALNDLGDCYEKGIGAETNLTKAVEYWMKAAEKKHGWAACKVAIRHQKNKKTDEAFAWFRKSADIGSDYACCKLGECYERGWGTETNAVEAAKWFLKGAERNHAWGMEKTGDFYASGYGVEKDVAKAREWYEKAVKRNGSKSAQKKLSELEKPN